jgi:hypothetical protein
VYELTEQHTQLLRQCGSLNPTEALPAQAELTRAMAEEVYQTGVLDGDIVGGIFESVQLDDDAPAEFLLDLINPGTERDYIAFYLPDTGHVPERTVSMNKVLVPTIPVGNSINCPLKFLRQKRVDILGRMLEALEAGFVMRDNLDGFAVILAAGKANGTATVDPGSTAGTMTLPLVAKLKLKMRRATAGNGSSVNKHRLTDLFVSPEALEDIRVMTHDAADDTTRRALNSAESLDGFTYQGVTYHGVDELGEGQLFQNYWVNTLGVAMTGSKLEICIGLDRTPNGKRNFKNPKRRGLEMFEDPGLHRRQEFGWYAWKERGWSVLSSKPVVIGQI